jgi:hypothetical protein
MALQYYQQSAPSPHLHLPIQQGAISIDTSIEMDDQMSSISVSEICVVKIGGGDTIIGEVVMAPNDDGDVKLRYCDGSKSDYLNISLARQGWLTRATQAERNEFARRDVLDNDLRVGCICEVEIVSGTSKGDWVTCQLMSEGDTADTFNICICVNSNAKEGYVGNVHARHLRYSEHSWCTKGKFARVFARASVNGRIGLVMEHPRNHNDDYGRLCGVSPYGDVKLRYSDGSIDNALFGRNVMRELTQATGVERAEFVRQAEKHLGRNRRRKLTEATEFVRQRLLQKNDWDWRQELWLSRNQRLICYESFSTKYRSSRNSTKYWSGAPLGNAPMRAGGALGGFAQSYVQLSPS